MYKLRTISIKTQVRRLKYFSVFIDFLGWGGLQKELLEDKVLDWSNSYRDDFLGLTSPTGEILKKASKVKSRSFQNYLDAARRLRLIERDAIYIKLTQTGLVLNAIGKVSQDKEKSKNAYRLNSLEKIFFLYTILLYDADIFITILRMVYENPGRSLDFYLEKYQEFYKSRLKEKMNVLFPPEIDKVLGALNRVAGWRSAKRYCEDIVPSRLNWMLDLCLFSEKKHELNLMGKSIYEHFPVVADGVRDIGEEWFNNNLASLLCCLLPGNKIKNWTDMVSKEKDEIMAESFFHAMKYLSVLNVPRMPVAQTFLFITLFLLSQRNIKIEFGDISEWMGFEKVINGKKLGLRPAARPGESYIRIFNA
jgi:hypothetical protein